MSVFQELSRISRERKLALFHHLMQPASTLRVLDLGAQIDPDNAYGGQFIDRYPWKAALSALNIRRNMSSASARAIPRSRRGSATPAPSLGPISSSTSSGATPSSSTWAGADQQKMAQEIMRVGRRWFVTTPNRWYPFEFHLRLPLVTWLPWHGYLWCGRLLSYNHACGRYMRGLEPGPLRLLEPRSWHGSFRAAGSSSNGSPSWRRP